MAGIFHDSDQLTQKRNFILKETARCLAAQSKFYSAAAMLEDTKESLSLHDIHDSFLMVECYIRLGRERKAEKAMKEVNKIFLKSPHPEIDLLKLLADSYHTEQAYVRELFARRLLCEIYFTSQLPKVEVFEGAHQCLHDIQSVSKRLYKSKNPKSEGPKLHDLLKQLANDSDDESEKQKKRPVIGETRLQVIALDYGLEYMKHIFKNLEATPLLDSAKKARDLAKCTNAIGYLYGVINDHSKSMAMRQKGIKIMDDEFGLHAVDYNLYGDLHHNVAVSLFNRERFKEAKVSYEKAINAYHSAVDYPNQEMRNKDLKQSQSDLRQARNKL